MSVGDHWQEHQGSELNRTSGEPREGEDLWTSNFTVVKVNYTAKGMKGLHQCN